MNGLELAVVILALAVDRSWSLEDDDDEGVLDLAARKGGVGLKTTTTTPRSADPWNNKH